VERDQFFIRQASVSNWFPLWVLGPNLEFSGASEPCHSPAGKQSRRPHRLRHHPTQQQQAYPTPTQLNNVRQRKGRTRKEGEDDHQEPLGQGGAPVPGRRAPRPASEPARLSTWPPSWSTCACRHTPATASIIFRMTAICVPRRFAYSAPESPHESKHAFCADWSGELAFLIGLGKSSTMSFASAICWYLHNGSTSRHS
jgi:hypothetical protein